MSIFRASKDSTVDDSVALTCTIESAYNLKDHTVSRLVIFSVKIHVKLSHDSLFAVKIFLDFSEN